MQRSVMTLGLIALNVLVWLGNVLSGLDIMNPDPQGLLRWGGNLFEFTLDQPWRLLSATFLHAGIIHLGLNMMSLHSVGQVAEIFYGRKQFLALYLLSGLWGSIASLFFGASHSVSVGASGAIFGVTGALLAAVFTKGHLLNPQFVKSLRNSLLFFTAFSLYMGFTIPAIDNAAHIGGLVAGAICGWVMPEAFDTGGGIRRRPWRTIALIAGSLVLSAVIVLFLRSYAVATTG